jgi:hypothetical protein
MELLKSFKNITLAAYIVNGYFSYLSEVCPEEISEVLVPDGKRTFGALGLAGHVIIRVALTERDIAYRLIIGNDIIIIF